MDSLTTPGAGFSPAAPASEDCRDTTRQPGLCLAQARDVLTQEAAALIQVARRLTGSFDQAVDLLHACPGKVVVTGMGKSGHIASKIAATLASTGTPAFFVHPAELRHGDFGMLADSDLLLALSGSGETQEIKLLIDPVKRLGIRIIAITGNLESALARFADVVIDAGVEREACPLNLAPTSSTTVALALGDALAVVLMTRKNFKIEDFARAHPGGSLGQSLITVGDIMRTGQEIPSVREEAPYKETLEEIDSKGLGFTAVCDRQMRLVGMITDGDLRRAQVKWGESVFARVAADIMTRTPKTIAANGLAVEALRIMEKHSISDLLIADRNTRPLGLIHLKDLLRAGII